MKTKLSRKRAISTVLTTVIILVASVVLGSGVVLYGTSLFQSGTQTESIAVSNTKVWVHTSATEGLAWGATGVRNTGDKVLAVDKISIRGEDIPFNQWYVDSTVSTALYQQALNHSGWDPTIGPGPGGFLVQDATGCGTELIQIATTTSDEICAAVASGPVSLDPGNTAIIYFKLTNGTITALDSGVNTGVNIFAGKAGAPQSITVRAISYQP